MSGDWSDDLRCDLDQPGRGQPARRSGGKTGPWTLLQEYRHFFQDNIGECQCVLRLNRPHNVKNKDFSIFMFMVPHANFRPMVKIHVKKFDDIFRVDYNENKSGAL